MTTTDHDITALILQIAQEPSIALETRHDFLHHVQTHGLDEKSLTFIKTHLDRLSQESQIRLTDAQHRLDTLTLALEGESLPQVSGKQHIAHTALEDMEQLLETFKIDYKAHQSQTSHDQEHAENIQHQNLIADLKGGL